MWVDNMYLNASVAKPGGSILVTCQIQCWSTSTDVLIAYNNGSGWDHKYFGACSVSQSLENFSLTITVNDVIGTHYIRCTEGFTAAPGMVCDILKPLQRCC